MSAEDRVRWDRRYLESQQADADRSARESSARESSARESSREADARGAVVDPPAGFAAVIDVFPDVGTALDVACGAGGGAVWLAQRGLSVTGVDVSPVAIGLARRLASDCGVEANCRFIEHDLDIGLPSTSRVDLITCHLFSAPDLDAAILERLAPGGMLAVTVLSEVGGESGPFRAKPGELLARFGSLDVRHHHEADGRATLVAVATGPSTPGRLD